MISIQRLGESHARGAKISNAAGDCSYGAPEMGARVGKANDLTTDPILLVCELEDKEGGSIKVGIRAGQKGMLPMPNKQVDAL